MKRLTVFMFIALFLSFTQLGLAEEINADSKIKEVSIYPDSALITRAAGLNLKPGEYKIILADIKPEIDENSLRVSSNNNSEVKLFGAQLKREQLEKAPAENVKKLQDEIQALQDQKKKIEDRKEVLSQEKSFLDSIRLFSGEQIPKDLVTKFPGVDELQKLLAFLDTKLNDNYTQTMQSELDIRELDLKIDAKKRELSQIAGPARKMKRSIVVDLELSKAAKFDLMVSYLARGASWQPIYDARANFDKAQVELVSYALVRQSTGEDWQDIDINLSTAKPSIGGNLPYVAPWILRPYQPMLMKAKGFLGSRMADTSQTQAFNVEALNAAPGIGGLEEKEEVSYSQAQEKGTAVVYKLNKRASVVSDATEHKLPVSAQMLAADFKYSIFPRRIASAYLGSRVRNAANLQLLNGRVNIFLDGDFVGASSIETIGPGEEFDLYLGADENVKVKFEQIDKKVDETLIGGIPSPDRRINFTNKITLENYKSKDIKVHLFETMPVPENDKIKVKIGNVNIAPNDKDWKDRKGVWRWELGLKPKEKKEIIYSYTIEHPRNMVVEGL